MIVRPSSFSYGIPFSGSNFIRSTRGNSFVPGSRRFNGDINSFLQQSTPELRRVRYCHSSSSSSNSLIRNTMVGVAQTGDILQMNLFSGQLSLGQTAALTVGTALVIGFVKYRGSINKRLKQLQESSFFSSKPPIDPFRMIRIDEDDDNRGENTQQLLGKHKQNKKYNLVSLNDEWKNYYNSLDVNHSSNWGHLKVTSLGEYLSTLRPNMIKNKKMPNFIETEIQNALASALLKGLGPQFGTAILPVLGFGGIRNTVSRLATGATKYITTKTGNAKEDQGEGKVNGFYNSSDSKKRKGNKKVTIDGGSLPLSLFAMTYVAEANYQRLKNMEHPEEDMLAQIQAKGGYVSKSPLQKLQEGEVGFQPSFFDSNFEKEKLYNVPVNDSNPQDASDSSNVIHNGNDSAKKDKNETAPLVPNPFRLDADWSKAIEGMEHLLISSSEGECEWKSTPMENPNEGTADRQHCYDPNSRVMTKPKPLDQRILPDLHLGWGDALCTHTDREILVNRLLCVLLNKLAYNYQIELNNNKKEGEVQMKEKLFVVQITSDGPHITKPAELIHELIQMGHTVEACVRTHLTTFGVALCVKEKNDKFTNIPLGYFLQNGQTNVDGEDAYVALPHSGLNVEIRNGPLIKHGSIQHFIGIEGLCGWHSNHNADVPWLKDIDCGPVMYNQDTLQAFHVAAMEANIMGTVGTKLNLPLGGYGLTGVCNDSAALVEYSLFEKTNVYPLTFNGRFAMENLRMAKHLKEGLLSSSIQGKKDDQERKAIDGLIKALCEIKSDINSLPSEISDQIQRQINCLPKSKQETPFQMMCQTKRVIKSLEKELNHNVSTGTVTTKSGITTSGPTSVENNDINNGRYQRQR